MKKYIINKIGNWVEDIALKNAYILSEECIFLVGEGEFPEKLKQIKREVYHHEDYNM